MRFRLRWRKWGKLRYLSHHDEALVFERSARRGRVPLAYTNGFTAHPRIAFGSGLPVGYGSDVELMDIGLSEPLEAGEVIERYNSGLPQGLEIIEAVALPRGADSLGALIQAADYDITTEAPWAARRLQEFLLLDSYHLVRPYKGGERTDDLRAGVVDAAAIASGVRIRTLIKPRATRPSDVWRVIEGMEGVTGTPVGFQRTGLLARRADELVELTVRDVEMKVSA